MATLTKVVFLLACTGSKYHCLGMGNFITLEIDQLAEPAVTSSANTLGENVDHLLSLFVRRHFTKARAHVVQHVLRIVGARDHARYSWI